jgi:methylthioribose-1-phosphate isomerase
VQLYSIFGQKLAPDGVNVWNPAFDVTPCSLIRGIITELVPVTSIFLDDIM